MSKIKKISIILIIFSLIFVLFYGYFNVKTELSPVDAMSSTAKSMCLIDKDSGRILYSKNPYEKLPMASTTKVVTAITVLEHCDDLDETIVVADEAIGVEGTSIYLRKDEEIKVIDLLYGLMLRSGNDSATALACHVAGGVDEFADMMNETAEKVGATSSHFTNPHGLDDPDHYTTAYDLSLITAYALGNPTFKEIVSTRNYVIEATNKSDKRYLTNKNKLLLNLPGCCGVKTGFTSKAGRCLVSALEQDGSTAVCVVLNCGPMFEESSALLTSAFEEYDFVKLIDKDKEIYNEYIIDENEGKLYLYAEEDFYYPLKKLEMRSVRIKYTVDLDDAKSGDEVGKIEIFLENDLIKTLKLYTMNKIDKLIDSDTLRINEVLWEDKINEDQ